MWFDREAAKFDDSAGLAPEVGRSIAQAILKLGGCKSDDIILDVGAGTGSVGLHFAALPTHYLGLDRSGPMLEIFRRKLTIWPQPMLLAQADSDRPWPIRDHSVAVVFASRVVHHLSLSHFVDEVCRVCRSAGCLLLGHVVRDAQSLPSQLQRYKRNVMTEHGLDAPGVSQVQQQIVQACLLRGADAPPPTSVARWTRTTTAGQMLASWRSKPQLSSRTRRNILSNEQCAALLRTLTEWAQNEFGDLERVHEFTEAYTLQEVRLP
jgi:ubiquinone/menaquinone biosynthesis C-methylase UbiE